MIGTFKFLAPALALISSFFCALAWAEPTLTFRSPHEQIEVAVSLGDKLLYQVKLKDKVLIENSQLGVVFQQGGALSHLKLLKEEHWTSNSTYSMPFGKKSIIRDHFNEHILTLQEETGLQRKIVLEFKLYDDGVAFRYSFPEQAAFSDFIISDESTEFALASDPTLYALPLPFSSSYEGYYRVGKLDTFKSDTTIALPLLLEYPSGQYLAITEADLSDYAGMYVAASASKTGTLETRLAPWLNEPTVKVRGKTPFVSPWRVMMIGESPKTLIESNLVYNLNEPSKIPDTSWIKPGKVQFPWWNGYVVPKPDPDHKPGLNTWTLKHYIDFCAENGIAYHSIDGFDQAWYGGPIDPFQGTDTTQPISDIDMPEVLRYAKSKGVGTRLWMNWAGLAKNIDKALDTYESWGVEGIMVDFLNRDDQEMVRSYTEILHKTAAHHLTVNFHGVFKPTGQARTYPHLLNHESVLGSEYNKWSDVGSPPDHEVMIAYVRMLAGPLDTHEGSFRPVAPDHFHSSYIAPQAMGTLARQLAMYVVYENHIPMLADYPEAYEAIPEAFQYLKEIPVVWDETRFLVGQVGKYIVIARRKGTEWYIGSITDRDARDIKLPLDFLGEGSFTAEVYSDTSDYLAHPEKLTVKTSTVRSSSSIELKLAPAGGNAIRIFKK